MFTFSLSFSRLDRAFRVGALFALGALVAPHSPAAGASATATPDANGSILTPPSAVVRLSEKPTSREIAQCNLFPEPLVPTGETSADDNVSIAKSLAAFVSRNDQEDFSSLESFVAAFPQSPYRLSILNNLGTLYFKA